jgi:hypothetical protein
MCASNCPPQGICGAVLGTGAGFAALPNLTTVPFTSAKTNGAPANLAASEEIQLIDSAGKVIGSPSAPNASRRRLQRLRLGDELLARATAPRGAPRSGAPRAALTRRRASASP